MTSRLTVEAARFIRLAISRIDESEAIPREISSRSARVRARGGRRRAAGRIPPRGSKTDRMQLCSLPKAPQFHAATVLLSSDSRPPPCRSQKAQTFSLASCQHHLSKTADLSDGVASTYRMHRRSRTSGILGRHVSGNPTQELDRGQPGYQVLLGFYCFHPFPHCSGNGNMPTQCAIWRDVRLDVGRLQLNYRTVTNISSCGGTL